MRILTEQGFIDAVALFFELTDEQLVRIQSDRLYYLDAEFVKECMKAKGDNAHFYSLCNNSDRNIVFKHLENLRKQYKTVSWWDREMQEFKIRR